MAPTAFWSDLHEDDSIYRSRPPRIAKVRAIEATARLLRPTKASIARATEKKTKNRLSDDMDKENVGPNGGARRSQRKRKLTIPQSPKFHAHPRKKTLPREQQLTMTSRELREIEALRKKVKEMRQRNQKYHESTTRSVLSYAPKTGQTSEAQSFQMALQASGGVGIPAVRRQRLTTPVGFQLESDKRAAARKHNEETKDHDE